MTASRTTDDLTAVLAPFVKVVVDVIEASVEMAGVGAPAVSSPAMGERARETALATADAVDPVAAAHSVAGLLRHAAADHLRSYVESFVRQPVPVFSHVVMARVAIESAAWAYWLCEPRVDRNDGATLRVQRYSLLRLKGAKDLKRSPVPQFKDQGKFTIARVRDYTQAMGWACTVGDTPRVGGETLPAPRGVMRAVIANGTGSAELEEVAEVVWTYGSGIVHGAVSALLQSVDAPPSTSTSAPQVTAPLFSSSDHVLTYGYVVVDAFVAMVERQRALFGWPGDAWAEAARRASESRTAYIAGRRQRLPH